MISNEFYLGLPNEIWNNFLYKTEDIFREQDIGTHIVGVYPAGKRIYGIESVSPEYICLYIDAAETLLDPTVIHNPMENSGVQKVNALIDGSGITFIHLFDWVQWLIAKPNQKTELRRMEFQDLIPCHQDIMYQDQSISNLILEARESIDPSETLPLWPVHKTDYLDYALYLRTVYLFQRTNRFSPNVNPDWGKVESLDVSLEEIKTTDELIQKAIRKNEEIEATKLAFYISTFLNLVQKRKTFKKRDSKIIGKEVIKLYKFLL